MGCTLCKEDQTTVALSNGRSFQVCHKVAGQFKTILEGVIKKGFPVDTILGYRPSKSKGPADPRGFRTEFSNHAFGVSLDVNENQNGLYNKCTQWNPGCVLAKGGAYKPHLDPRSITRDTEIVKLMLKNGFKWGGEIQGVQKDFMHFSPDGY